MEQHSVPTGGLNPSQYDFINNPSKPKKRGGFFSGGTGIQKYLILTAFIVVVLIVIVGILSIFTGGSSDRNQLIALAKSQNSLIALAENGQENSTDARLTNISSTVIAIISSDRVSTISKIEGKVNDAEIKGDLGTLAKSLEDADTNGTFDETYTAALEQSLVDYNNRLQDVFNSSSSTSTKEILQTSSNNIQIINDTLQN